MRIEIDNPARTDMLALLEEHLRNMHELSPPESVLALDVSGLKSTDMTFWSVREGDLLLGCGALRQLTLEHGEIKSMRTPAALRRHGAGRAILNHILEVARVRGYKRLSLETGTAESFAAAHRLYEGVGFFKCGPFGDYKLDPHSVFMSLDLTRNGVPIGALTAGATVTVAKESGQATQTLLPQNLAKMISRLPTGSFARSVWIVNNDVLPALFTLTLGNYPIYLPNGLSVGGIQVSPYGTLLGRPVFVSQHANSFSGQGDVLLVDLSYYQTITKAGGLQTATSMHLYFDADLTAFRTTFRMDGQSKVSAPISPAKGSATMSPFIQLGAR